ncbi:MAG: hypothetical protein HDS65_10935 [Bacteroidales bacterium]|nr:hypothetical protein [Bacteroidales bacterium]
MKKLMLGACALLALAAASCGKCGEGNCKTAANDSLANAYGEYVGTMLYGEYSQFDGDKTQKQDFLRGMQLVFSADGSRDTRMGMQVALQMMNELSQLEEQGVPVNKAAVMQAFKKSFLADSIGYMDIQQKAGEFQDLYRKAMDKAAAEKEAEAAAAPDATENGLAAAEYIANLKEQGTDVQTTENGLSYVIENPGVAPKPTETATVVVNYTGKHLDGKIFDTTEGRGPATFNLQGVVPGFREGLMLIGKGGKATLYIPGNLAYGNNGQPAAGIGPNEMLVFDVELLDIAE